MRLLFSALALFAATVAMAQSQPVVSDATFNISNPQTLSAFRFFSGDASKPSDALIPYALRTPLFSDYAVKQRYMYLPASAQLEVDATGKLSFPIGTALIKSFGYPNQSGGLKVIETRVLLHRSDGWVALPYVWRADGSDADLRVGGTRLPVHFNKPNGDSLDISYAIPNKNQCKQCHSADGAILPIGPVWQNLEFPRAGDKAAMLQRIRFTGSQLAAEAQWDDAKSGSLDQRAHAYLRVNCGHCHAPKGSASNSGLILDGSARDIAAFGIGKRPVAAGRASGDMDFVIEPGHPERSILISRMKSTDPGIAMPELGRAAVHDEGVALLEEWIAGFKPH